VFFIDHRNDIAVNAFGLMMSILGSRVKWYADPIGAILIGLLILVSWAANAFEHVWLLVGKGAPKEFISKLIYLVVTHDTRIRKVETVSVAPTPSMLVVVANLDTSAEPTMLAKDIMWKLTLSWTRRHLLRSRMT
jgi:divalent metal cation (Fe/Co/Zn/Cd) transporter